MDSTAIHSCVCQLAKEHLTGGPGYELRHQLSTTVIGQLSAAILPSYVARRMLFFWSEMQKPKKHTSALAFSTAPRHIDDEVSFFSGAQGC